MRARGLLVSLLFFALPTAVSGAVLRVTPAPGALAEALARAAAGDTLVLRAGTHRGPVVLSRKLTILGEPGAVLDGGRSGTVLEIGADGCRIQDLVLCSTGNRVLTADSGIRIRQAASVSLSDLILRDVLYGIYAERCGGLTIERCVLTGRAVPGAETADGNGIHLWYCESPTVRDCSVRRFADAVYLSFVNGATIEGSRFEWNARYGFHTMYCQKNRLAGNRFAHNLAGCAIMFSNHLEVTANDFIHNQGPRTYGLLLRDCSDGVFSGNRLVDNTIAAFLDGSNRNRIERNLIQDNGWGILLFSSSEGNEFSKNAFLNNDYPVALDMRYTENRFDDGRSGNYWSENAAYDLDGDGIGDVPYSPVSAFAFLSKQYPDLAVLAKSPAVVALTVAERVIPALRPSEAVDRHPLLRPLVPVSTGVTPDERGTRRSPGGAALFSGLALLGVMGLAAGRRSR
jgi:nitrous oxidase accessory protein